MKQIYVILLCLIILYFIYLVYYKVKENFTNNNNVNLPFDTTISCLNKCAPGNNSCYITGEQCIRDGDCYGCEMLDQPPVKEHSTVIGDNDAGKLTDNITPNYSTLTTDIGTKAGIYNHSQLNKPPPQYNKGLNTWRKVFDEGKLLFDKRYNPSIIIDGLEPNYEEMPTLSGEFSVIGPKPSNY
jgi:hypothetical protein